MRQPVRHLDIVRASLRCKRCLSGAWLHLAADTDAAARSRGSASDTSRGRAAYASGYRGTSAHARADWQRTTAAAAAARCDADAGSSRVPACASRPSMVCRSRCSRWMACVCARSSSTRQHEASIQQLFVEIDSRRRQEDHHRTFDPVLMRHQPARVPGPCRSTRSSARLPICSSFSA